MKSTLRRLNGVSDVTASHAANVVNVTFDEQQITPSVITTAIESLGYRVTP